MTLDGGAGSFTTSKLTAGSHAITANYSGSADFVASTGTMTQTVQQSHDVTGVPAMLGPLRLGAGFGRREG